MTDERVIFRIDIWHKRELKYPDFESPARTAGDIGDRLYQRYRTADQLSMAADAIFETRPAIAGAIPAAPTTLIDPLPVLIHAETTFP